MCAGAAAAKAANRNARRQWKYQMEVRERKHMQRLSVYKTGLVQYDKSLQNIHQGLSASYDRAQVRLNRVREKAFRSNSDALTKMMQNSKYGDLMARGRTGRSIARMGIMEKGALGRFYAQRSAEITDAREDFMLGVKRSRQRAKLAQENEFTKVAFQPVADVAPPPPVRRIGLKNPGRWWYSIGPRVSSSQRNYFSVGPGLAAGVGSASRSSCAARRDSPMVV